MKVLVTGAGGFIGWHLTNYLYDKGHDVYGIDIKMPQFAPSKAGHFQILDLRLTAHVIQYFMDNGPFDEVYALAADMGGIGYIENNRADIMRNNVMINCNTLNSTWLTKCKKYLFTSSACVYPSYLQDQDACHDNGVVHLKESEVYPAQPEEGYGWEKLYTEMLCKYYASEFGMSVRVVRLHNIYGPYGTYEGGREKAPAALCRKVIMAKKSELLEIWGDGKQVRTFCYITDCIKGLSKIMASNYMEPVNLGSDKPITIDNLAEMVMGIAGKKLIKSHKRDANIGVHGRSSDNALLKKITNGWSPQVNYADGLTETYKWIESEIHKRKELSHATKNQASKVQF